MSEQPASSSSQVVRLLLLVALGVIVAVGAYYIAACVA